MYLYKNWEIIEILDDIILGRGVKRAIHNLEYDNMIYTSVFVDRLRLYKFRPVTLADITIEPGKRVPGFLIKDKTAIFGYVFWEFFSERKKRKLWGSVVRNEKGDWKYTVQSESRQALFVNPEKTEDFDMYHAF